MALKLVIGNKNYSSWSLRAWLHLRASGIDFEEIRVPLFTGNWSEELARFTPSRRVPVLIDGDVTVWDTMAIHAHVLELHADAVGWPKDRVARAHARSIAAEMHSGFLGVRGELPQNLRRRRPRGELSAAAEHQVARIVEIWSDCRARYGDHGPWLFGPMSLADIAYTPVALRLVSYEIRVVEDARFFIDAVQGHPEVQHWIREAEAEEERIDFIDDLAPIDAAIPMTLG